MASLTIPIILCAVFGLTTCYRMSRIWPDRETVNSELAQHLEGDLIRPWDDNYFAHIINKNLEFDRRPGAIAFVENREDIRKCILFARKYDLGVNIRSTGHGFLGRSTADHVLLIDTSRMNKIFSINVNDPESDTGKSAIVEAGTVWETIYEEVDKHKLVAVGPNPLSIGVSGYLLAGGHGPMTRRFGMGSDSVMRISLVTALGDYVDCTNSSTFKMKVDGSTETIPNGDLFWALRGGGSAFGVITEFKIKLHPAPDQFVQMSMFMAIEHPVLGEPFRHFMQFYGNFISQQMSHNWGGYILPNNAPGFDIFWNTTTTGGVTVSMLHYGNWTEAMRSIEPLTDWMIGRAFTTFTNHSSFWSYVQNNHEGIPGYTQLVGRLIHAEDFNDNLEDLLNEDLLDTFQFRMCTIIKIGGRAAEIPASTSAVSADFRTALWVLNCSPPYGDPRDKDFLLREFQPFRRKMYTMGRGAYYNECDYDLEKWPEEFWGDHYPRLQQIKGVWDPENFFTCHMCVETNSQS